MGELVKTLRHYVARDLVFLVSGGAVVAAFLYVFSPALDPRRWPTISYALAAGIAYVVGYAVQDICSVIRLVTTAPLPKPGHVTECVYGLFMRTPWLPITQGMDCLYKRQDKWERTGAEGKAPDYERIVMLMQIGTSGGPCALICAGLLSWKIYGSCLTFDIALSISAWILGCVLLILGWLKAAQMTQLLIKTPPSA